MTELEKCQLAKEKGFSYCPVSGDLRGVRNNVIRKKHLNGYIECQVYYATKPFFILGHRLAWYLYYGDLPINSIDHIDGNKSNNRIDNLRDVTNQQNHWNRTTAKGYYLHKSVNKFCATITINKKNKHLGCFNTEQDAHNAYLKAKETYHVIND